MPHHKIARERKLPVQQLSILAICRFAEPISATSIFPYLPEMVQSFNVPENEIGKWAGLCSGVFSASQAVFGVPWGRFSDKHGRKIAISLGLTTAMLTTLLWGFSTNLAMAITARAIAGAGNGNVGIIRTTVAEMVPFKELQPRAFSLMPLVWNLGSVIGPSLGGVLANVYNVRPGEHIENPNLLQRFPYALPNIVAAAFYTVGITTGVLFLRETLSTRQDQRDYGLILGQKLSKGTRSLFRRAMNLFRSKSKLSSSDVQERRPLLDPAQDDEALILKSKKPALPPPSYREVLNKQAILNLIVYTFIALHTMGYDQLLPVFMHYPSHQAQERTANDGNPLKFASGLGLDHFRIGLISTTYGICGMVAQFLFFPPAARRFGVLNCLKACAIVFPIAYFVTPFAALLPTTNTQIAGIFAIMLLKCFASIFAFPSSTILLTNSASSLRVLGTLNGVATSVSAIGRACGPLLGGNVFSAGVKKGYVIAPWWMFSAIAVVAAIPVWWLVEGEGFGGDDDGHVSDEEEEEEEAIMDAAGVEGAAEAAGKAGPILMPTEQQANDPRAAGTLPSISRTTTVSSVLSLGSALSPIEGEDDDEVMEVGSTTPTGPSGLLSSRRTPIKRKMSFPVGTGREGISRRLSSNLGQSLGSAGSYHGH